MPARVIMLRSAWAGILCATVVATAEAWRAWLGLGAPAASERLAILATAVVVLLPLGLFLGTAMGGVLAALRVVGDPGAWASAVQRGARRVGASGQLGLAAGLTMAFLVGLSTHRAALGSGAPPDRAGLGVGLATLAAVLPAACVGLPVAAAVRGALGRRDDEPASSRLLLAAVAVLALLAFAVVASRERETLEAIDWRLPLGLLLAGVAFLVAQALVWRVAALRRRGVVAGVALLAVGLSIYGTTALDRAPTARAAVLDAGGLLHRALAAAQRPFDRDGDGHASLFGGADCDDSLAGVFPGADEVPGNGVDEDCTGSDLPLPPAEEPPAAPAVVEAPAGPRGGPVILLSVDTLRWQNLGAYGYDRPTSPHMDSLAAESLLFHRAYAPSNKTPSSIPAIWTGRYPSELSRTLQHFSRYDDGGNRFVAEMLKDAGYRTGGVAAHWYFRPKFGLHQGFDDWHCVFSPGEEMERVATSEEVTDRALETVSRLEAGGNERFLLVVHYLDPHKWYIDHPGFEPFGRRAKDRYDGEIRFTDHHVGRLLEALRSRPWWSKALVALYSDHGEAFGEHGERFHGWSLFEHETRVPFLLKVPGLAPGQVGTPVGLIDLVPTVLDFAGAPREDDLAGASLLPALRRGREWPARPIYTEMPPGPYNAEMRALIDSGGRTKVIHRRWGNVWQIYDLQADAGERENQASDGRLLQRLQDRLQRFRSRNVRSRPARRVEG